MSYKKNIIGIMYKICVIWVISLFLLPFQLKAQLSEGADSIANGKFVKKSIYAPQTLHHGSLYNKLWGVHYRDMYLKPILSKTLDLSEVEGGLVLEKQIPHIHGLFMRNGVGDLFLLRIVGGSSTFMQSAFFRDIYNKNDFKETYLDKFIGEAYTITNPYSFLVADRLADQLGLSSFNPQIYYLPKGSTVDTIADGSCISDRLVAIYDLKKYNTDSHVFTTEEVLKKVQDSKSYFVNQDEYVRERLLAMLIGDWNKVPENWMWYEKQSGDSLIYSPIVLDRGQAFTKVDGVFLKSMLGVLNLGSISSYDGEFKKMKKSNSLSFALDVALSNRSGVDVWISQAKFIQEELTDRKIDDAFQRFPKEIQGTDTETIKLNFKKRKKQLIQAAQKYYNILQKTPVIVGTVRDDRFEIEQFSGDSLSVSIFSGDSDNYLYRKNFNKRTQEIWVYGLDGNDSFIQKGDRKRSIPLLLVGGDGKNSYKLDDGNNIKIYEYKDHNKSEDSLSGADIMLTNVENVHEYNYEKLKYKTLDFTPMGIYDSDLGLSLGAYLTYTMYGFKRVPYTYRHRLGYNYLEGFSYLGFFPPFDERFNLIVEASLTTPNNFYNFFGFGNQTPGYKDKKNSYNQVKIDRYNIAPSLYWRLNDQHRIIGTVAFELFQLKDKYDESRFINQVYEHGDEIFKNKTFVDLGLTYEISQKFGDAVSKVELSTTLGWKLNLGEAGRNFTYWKGNAGINLKVTDRITFATKVVGNLLFTDKYEFYQAATTKLRGYRDNRFIGKQSVYQFSDLRFDLGRLENPFTPVLYGVFGGFDYGRVWYADEKSKKWHTSCGGGFWLTFFKKYTGKFSYFGSKDGGRFYIDLGMGF